MTDTPILTIRNLRKLFPTGKSGIWGGGDTYVHAIDDVSFELRRGEVLALVGESGCGKSTLVLTLMGLEQPTSGEIAFEGRGIVNARGAELKELRRHIQMVFQDPYESLNPHMTVDEI